MILVLCLNAAVDKTLVLEGLRLRRLNRPRRVVTLPGGKGINVARALAALRERSLVLGFTAGYTGDHIEASMRAEGLAARWIRLEKGRSRTCLAVIHGAGGPTEINEIGPSVSAAAFARLREGFAGLARRARLVIASGSLPPGCPDDAYGRLIRRARRLGRRVFLDASGAPLKAALAARPDLLKMNRQEAASLGLPVGRPAELGRALARLAARGPRESVVTLGPLGAVAYLGGRGWVARPPRVRSVSPVGCGDTFLAGLARELLAGRTAPQALAFAAGLATASALVPGAGLFRRADVARIVSRVRVEPLP